MTVLSIYTKLEMLPPALKQEAMIESLVEKTSGKNSGEAGKTKPVLGSLKGKIKLSEDFDSPLVDFREYKRRIFFLIPMPSNGFWKAASTGLVNRKISCRTIHFFS